MAIDVNEIGVSVAGKLDLDALDVTVVGNTITVSGGTITIEDLEAYEFPESEYEHTPDAVNDVGLIGYIVRDTADDSLQLFVDEFVYDGGDTPYDFSSGTLVPKFQIFNFYVQASADAADAQRQQSWQTKQC